ncbi:hypothetical protein [Klebsiella aerogenes]|uniref:Myb-like domain-containing protein n=1 Tax=Klebsiella aerogenes TaxID=548 RepID=A0AAP9QZ04_KLEAE|nr:hypothetical protein [Klebsiella aerogenes]QMR41597.1 hypothetical protein HV331_19785 [Klebsiella aerogenes]
MNDNTEKKRNHRVQWTIAEIHYLETHYTSVRVNDIAEHLGRTAIAVKAMAGKLALGKTRAPDWSEAEQAVLREHYETVMPVAEILTMLPGRPHKAVLAKARGMGLSRRLHGPSPSWSQKELQLLRHYYPTEGQTVRHRLTGRTENSIRQKARELGIRYVGHAQFRVWLDEDWQLLEKRQHEPMETLRQLFPERNITSLKNALSRLKQKQAGSHQIVKKMPTRRRKATTKPVVPWSDAEKAVLTQHYETPMPMKDILAQLPGRAKKSVFAMAEKLELKRLSHRWSDAELRILKQYYSSEGNDILARLPGRSLQAIRSKANEFNIRYTGYNGHFRRWSDDELQLLKERIHDPLHELQALFPARSPGSVRHAFRQMMTKQGHYIPAKPAAPWRDEEKSVLITYYETIMPMKQIMQMLPGRAKTSVFAMAATLGLTRPAGWSETELTILKKHYPSEGTSVASRLPGRTVNAVRRMASILNIRYLK